jgi:hypothetical protein
MVSFAARLLQGAALRFTSVTLALMFLVSVVQAQDSTRTINSSKILIKSEDYDGAKTMLTSVADTDARHAEALLLIAECDEGLGNIPAAIDGYRATVEKAIDERVKSQAQSALTRLDEGRKILAQHSAELLREADKFRGKNDIAFQTLMSGAQLLTGDAPIERALTKLTQKKPPPDAELWGNSRYKLYPPGLTWHMAKAKCEELGGRLVSIESADEWKFVQQFAVQGKVSFWIGLSNENARQIFQCDSGAAPEKFLVWGRGEPSNDRGAGNVVQLRADGLLNDLPSGYRDQSFLCEWTTDDATKPPGRLPAVHRGVK